ncbi:MAG: glycosyltransferase [Rhodobacteraceae bacterium]|nr:glycosyltransferase [Paracoccaceae bacterium]
MPAPLVQGFLIGLPDASPSDFSAVLSHEDGTALAQLRNDTDGIVLAVAGHEAVRLPVPPGATLLLHREDRCVTLVGPEGSLRRSVAEDRITLEWAELRPEAGPPGAEPGAAMPQILPIPTAIVPALRRAGDGRVGLEGLWLPGVGALRLPESVPTRRALALALEGLRDGAALLDRLAAEDGAGGAVSPALALMAAFLLGDDAPLSAGLPADLAAILDANGGPRVVRSTEPLPVLTEPAAAVTGPGLDVVVALYNQRDHVVACLDSLLAEADADLRVIVVDDGSTDGSTALVDSVAARDARVRLVRKANGGCASARNYGRLCGTGTHVAFVDADDLTEPGFFPALARVARASGAPVVSGGFAPFEGDPAGQTPPLAYTDTQLLAGQEDRVETIAGEPVYRLPAALFLGRQASIWRTVYRRDFLDGAGLWFPESIRAYDDFQFHMLQHLWAPEVLFVPARRYLYRQHPGQDIRMRDQRHFGNIAMAAALLRDPAMHDNPHWRQVVAGSCAVINWSAERISPALLGGFLESAALLLVAAARQGPVPLDELAATITHPDFPQVLRRARGALARSGAADRESLPWDELAPVAAHPNTRRLIERLAREDAP